MTADLDSLARAKATLLDLAVRFGPKLLVAVLIMAVGLVVGRWVARASIRTLHRFDLEPPVRNLMSRMARMLVLALFAMMALQNLGVELLPLIAGMGIAGAGIALATQGVLSNVVAGLTIIFTKPYRVGEYIAIIGVEGRVDAISLFNTELTHPDLSRVVVPNRKVVGEILHNYGRIRQSELQVGVAFDSDLVVALGTISDVVRTNPKVLAQPAPLIQVSRLGPAAVQITVKPWVAVTDYGVIEGELNVAILDALRRHDIVIPYLQQEVQLIGRAG